MLSPPRPRQEAKYAKLLDILRYTPHGRSLDGTELHCCQGKGADDFVSSLPRYVRNRRPVFCRPAKTSFRMSHPTISVRRLGWRCGPILPVFSCGRLSQLFPGAAKPIRSTLANREDLTKSSRSLRTGCRLLDDVLHEFGNRHKYPIFHQRFPRCGTTCHRLSALKAHRLLIDPILPVNTRWRAPRFSIRVLSPSGPIGLDPGSLCHLESASYRRGHLRRLQPSLRPADQLKSLIRLRYVTEPRPIPSAYERDLFLRK
jgi:hypothetical protein